MTSVLRFVSFFLFGAFAPCSFNQCNIICRCYVERSRLILPWPSLLLYSPCHVLDTRPMPPKLTTMIQGLFVGHWLMHDLLVLPLDVHRSSLPLLKMVLTLRYHLRTSIFISRTWKWNVLIVIWNKTNIILIHVTTWGALTLYITDIGWCYRWKGHPNYKIKGPYILIKYTLCYR